MNNSSFSRQYKLRRPCRTQIEFKMMPLDDLISLDHKARIIWDFVDEMDMKVCFSAIKSYDISDGRPATDPKILLALWIYSILDGNASARKLEELTQNHKAYLWICGGVTVNRTLLAEFIGNAQHLLEQQQFTLIVCKNRLSK